MCCVESNDDEGAYMFKLMNALKPPGWSNKKPVCQWTGVYCDYQSGRIEEIDLSSKSLTGTVPAGLNDSLSQLTELDLSQNNLSGPVPSLANLSFLLYVHLGYNNFTSIPHGCFHGLTSLQRLSLNNLMGSLPPNISHSFPGLPSLVSLNLGNNTNLAPWTFPNLTHSTQLKDLNLTATNVMGSLPEIFDSLPSLETLLLSNNNLSGVLPESFGGTKIATLHLNNQKGNGFSGPIDILSNMLDLSQVWLQGNSFTGPIPDMSRCTALQDLQLGHNQLTGVVPDSLIALQNLEYLYLGYNFLQVHLERNYFQGPLPVFQSSFTDVNTSNNGFCLDHAGPCDKQVTTLLQIAADFGYPLLLARSWRGNNPCQNWSFVVCVENKIRTLNLTKQNLTGTISPAFTNLTDLRELYLSGNNLSGPIPESLTDLPQLKILDVSNNNLSGNIPHFSPDVTLNTKVICNRKRCLSFLQWILWKKTGPFIDNEFEEFMKIYGSLMLRRYSYSEVKSMTNSFRDKLGRGGYGIVYKACLSDGCPVAVKVLTESSGSGEEFLNEVASIGRTSHMNIVSLLGFCYEKYKRALIYEFMPNGSLDKFIYKQESPNAICILDWNTLFQITIGIARGLEYLHRGCATKILHLDIKPQNILLDEDFCPKIADFGLAKICKKKESIVSIQGTRGTPGYIAPEVFSRTFGKVSHKSDVYSYGMLILELVGGRKNYDTGGSLTNEMYFPDWIYKDLEEQNILGRGLSTTEEENDMIKKITLVSLWCIQTNPLDRPSINKVVEMLEGPLQSVPYPPKPVLYSPQIVSPPLVVFTGTGRCRHRWRHEQGCCVQEERNGEIGKKEKEEGRREG
ncbi:hypothetical protein AAHE18_14G254200 [Arachis hypogaea]